MSLGKIFLQSVVWRGIYTLTILFQNIFFSRYFEAENTGWIYYYANVLAFILLVLSFSIDSGFTYFSSKRQMQTSKLLFLGLLWSLCIGIVGYFSSGFFINYFYHASTVSSSVISPLATSYVVGMLLSNFTLALYYSQGNFFLPNFLLSLTNIIVIILIPKSSHLLHVDEDNILKIYFLLSLFQAVVLFIVFAIKYKAFKHISLPSFVDIQKLVSYSFVALLGNILFFLVIRVDLFFVQNYAEPNQLGNYVMISRIGQMLLIIPQILASVVFPQIAKGEFKVQIIKGIFFITRLLSRFYLFLFLATILLGKFLFTQVFGSSFSTMHLFFLLFIPGLFSLSILSLFSAFFLGEGKIKVNFFGIIAGLTFLLIADVLFVPRGGPYVAAIISSISYTITLAVSVYFMKKNYDVQFSSIFFWKKEELVWITSLLRK